MSTLQILAFGFLFLFAATTVLFPGRKLVRRMVQLRRLRSSAARPVAGLSAGARALVLGTAMGELTLAPVSRTPCLFWHLRVYRLIRRSRRMPERRTSWQGRAQAPLFLADGTGTVEVALERADLSLLGTELQITTITRRQTDDATSVITDVRPTAAVPPSVPGAEATRWTTVPLTSELSERLRPLGFRPSWMWWRQSRTFVEEQCMLPEAPLLVLGRVVGEGEQGRLRLDSRVGERLIIAIQDVERLAEHLRAEIRLGAFVCVVLALFVLVGCTLTSLVR